MEAIVAIRTYPMRQGMLAAKPKGLVFLISRSPLPEPKSKVEMRQQIVQNVKDSSANALDHGEKQKQRL
ncbi:hypothetical protein PsorP6_011381 [Peronosclerospora sorghi]|uniref:Uncharacterized protein n=1 Tax=Peronosclerospora sorghi TaxID=230839 RepID=A0ACC0WKF3_9STRA|nr:hypothetical protein PsorP6_011381 [Peronosclerospora sorghi]